MAKKAKDSGIALKIKSFFCDEKVRFLFGIGMVFIGIFLIIAMISFVFSGGSDYNLLNSTLADFSDGSKSFQNLCGATGAKAANLLINQWFGIASFTIPVFLILLGYKLINPEKRYSILRHFFVLSFFTIWGSLVTAMFIPEIAIAPYLQLGGNHGQLLAGLGIFTVGELGMILILASTLLIFCVIAYVSFLPKMREFFSNLHFPISKSPYDGIDGENEAGDGQSAGVEPEDDDLLIEQEPVQADADLEITPDHESESDFSDNSDYETTDEYIDSVNAEDDTTDVGQPQTLPSDGDGIAMTITTGAEDELVNNNTAEQLVEELGLYDPTADLSHYQYPPFDLLKEYDQSTEIDTNEQLENKNRIKEVLGQFGITIKEISATVGPTVTLYEIVPGDGVRIARIKSLAEDIALSLAAEGIRIIAPIPGKGTVGIEVPNKKPQMVPMRTMIASKKFQESTMELPIAIGKTITNEVFMFDLAKMPHLLVAGATGQGKSVGLNAIVTSLLYKKHPSQLKIVMIDPKKVEFSLYSKIEKHFLAKVEGEDEPIITDTKKVIRTLNSLCKEMDDRYDLLKKAKKRNIIEYNDAFVNRKLNPEHGHKFLPYIVVVIDEFGDLIMTAGKDVELPICRIAQLARAVGIHMIIATQRPTTDIISGKIKANFPGRVAFRVMAGIDSRTILDSPGADQLVGRGDMLILSGGNLVRVQCAFTDTPEIEHICDYIEQQQGYPSAFILPENDVNENNDDFGFGGGGNNDSGARRDELFADAARLVLLNNAGSASLLQRKLNIGFSRAGRLIDQLESAGVVGSGSGSKPRPILMTETQLEEYLSQNNM
ncbi:MAG: DNA translocase FtsK [Paludibacteraceae bacterium]|nr:DNA translocase FtsK [Paludibacteraceae bacterium]